MPDSVTWGYARVSSSSQKLDRQLDALREYGIDERHIKTEKQSGKDFNRPEFLSLVGTEDVAPAMREGDCLVVLSLDRLGRNYTEICKWWRHITVDMKCSIVVLDMPLLGNSDGESNLDRKFIMELVLQIISYVSEKERISIKERQRQGIESAKAEGVRFGRPPVEKPDNLQQILTAWRKRQITATAAAQMLRVSKNTFYKFAKEDA